MKRGESRPGDGPGKGWGWEGLGRAGKGWGCEGLGWFSSSCFMPANNTQEPKNSTCKYAFQVVRRVLLFVKVGGQKILYSWFVNLIYNF